MNVTEVSWILFKDKSSGQAPIQKVCLCDKNKTDRII